MNRVKLSFCIPTLNRADYIGETLESIIPQLTDEIEVVIVDGASTDKTEEIVLGYKARSPQIRYFKQQQNMGVDRDYNNAVEYAQGEYCWIMTDDDLLKPGAVEAVIKALSIDDYTLVVVNAEVRNKDLSRVIENNLIGCSADKIYKPGDNQSLFVEVVKYLSFSGGIVIKRSFWMEREREKYFGSLFIEVGVIFQKPIVKDVLVISYPWVQIRYGNALWASKIFEVSMFKWPWIIWSLPNYSEKDKSKIIALVPWKKIRTLTLFRAVGAFALNEYRNLLKPRMSFGWRRLAAKVVAVIPPAVLNFLWIVYLSKVPDKSPMWLYDLKNSRYNHIFKRDFPLTEKTRANA